MSDFESSPEPTTMARNDGAVLWSDARLLGFGPLDDTHQEFYQVTFRLLTCNGAGALSAIARFEAHARQHFQQEEEWMITTNFPASGCHVDEHAAVLKSVVEVRQAMEDGRADESLAHDLARELFTWFPGHADYLDSALAAWMAKRQYGGQPVVVRRSVAHPGSA